MIFEEWFDNMLDTYPDDYYGVAKDAWNAAIAARDEELRKQEPVGYWHVAEDKDECDFRLGTDISGDCPDCLPLYAAPIPPEPTPSQQEALAYLETVWRDEDARSESVEKLLTAYDSLKAFILARPDEVTK